MSSYRRQTGSSTADEPACADTQSPLSQGTASAPPHDEPLHMIDRLDLLQTVTVFDRLSHAQCAVLATHLGVQSFGRGQTIFHQGDPGDTLYLIARGQVRVYHPSASGRELTVALFRAGDFFGELALLDGQPRSASAEAMLPTITLMLGQRTFRQLLRDHPAITEALLAVLTGRLRITTSYAMYLAIPAAHQRVGSLLLNLAQRYGVPDTGGIRIDFQFTQDEFASVLGMTRETVNRILTQLRDQGLIALEGKQIVVLDCGQIERMLA